MSCVNRVFLLGNLGTDPELRTTTGGEPWVKFPLATNARWKGANGERQERTDWHRVVSYGRNAEVAGEYLRKGHKVCVEGRLRNRQWEDSQGQKRYGVDVVMERLVMLGKPRSGDRDAPPQQSPPSSGDCSAEDLPF